MRRAILVTGMPLTGKSTFAKKIVEYLGDATYISTGDIARELIKESVDPDKLNIEMATTDMFPYEDLLRSELMRRVEASTATYLVLDGCPRSKDQFAWLRDKLWHYFPVLVLTDVSGSYEALYNRAKMRARDENDTDPTKLVRRLYIAASFVGGAHEDAIRNKIPVAKVYTDKSVEKSLIEVAKLLKGSTKRKHTK